MTPLILCRLRIAATFRPEVGQQLLLFRAHFLISQTQITDFDLRFNRQIRRLPLCSFFVAFGLRYDLYTESISKALLPLETNGAGR